MKFLWRGILILWVSGCSWFIAAQPVTPTPIVLTLSPASTPVLTDLPTLSSKTPLLPATPRVSGWPAWTPAIISTSQWAGTPGLFQGSVQLQSGLCCIGGIVGSVVDLRKDFAAQSPFGPVTEMRRREGSFCFSQTEMTEATWQPFVVTVTEPFTITSINWIGHFLTVQYRDELGNLSPVACDDISVEGMPAPPTPG
jgi:hypothetical protein